jgi:hypothetical protein
MYHKCRVNQAYSLAYGGQFGPARRLLRRVRSGVAREPESSLMPDQRQVLLRMCQSALLFVKRVEEVASRLSSSSVTGPRLEPSAAGSSPSGSTAPLLMLPTASSPVALSSPPSRTVDDLARIRVYRDESRLQDVVIPFRRLSAA